MGQCCEYRDLLLGKYYNVVFPAVVQIDFTIHEYRGKGKCAGMDQMLLFCLCIKE